MRAPAPRVLVVEDDDLVRLALSEALADEGWAVHAVADGRGIEEALEEFRPDVAVLDVRLPMGPDGYEIARRVRARSDLAIVFLTAGEAEEERLAGFEAGGDDYVVKPFSVAEVLARLRALVRRAGMVPAAVRTIGDLSIDEGAHTVTRAGSVVDLTDTEFALLSAMSRRPGQVFTKVELHRLVWKDAAANPNLVEVHVSALRRKLEAHGGRLVDTVHGQGYVLRP